MHDVYVRVWNRNAKIPVKKVFYQPNRLVGDRTKMDFEADIPLWAGSNLVQVFARESNEVQSLQTVVVLKRAPDRNIRPAVPARTLPRPREEVLFTARGGRLPRGVFPLAPRSGERVGTGCHAHLPRAARVTILAAAGAFQRVGVRIHRRGPGMFGP